MKLERLITIVTNLAVVAGMVLVVFELQQNREAIQIAHQLSLAGLISQAHLAVASEHELADLIARAKRNDTQDFSPADIERVNQWVLAYSWNRESVRTISGAASSLFWKIGAISCVILPISTDIPILAPS